MHVKAAIDVLRSTGFARLAADLAQARGETTSLLQLESSLLAETAEASGEGTATAESLALTLVSAVGDSAGVRVGSLGQTSAFAATRGMIGDTIMVFVKLILVTINVLLLILAP